MSDIDIQEAEAENSLQSGLSPGNFWMRPLVRLEEILTIIEENKNMRLRTRGLAYGRDLSELLFRDTEEAYRHGQQVTGGVFGTQGFGKSEIMKIMMYQCQQSYFEVKGVEPDLFVTFGMNDTFRELHHISGVAILGQDEDPFTSGAGSATATNAMQNVQEIVMRYNDISFIYAAVNPKSGKMKRNINHWLLEPIAINRESRTTFCILYSGRTFLELGHVILKILPEDNWLTRLHSKKEQEYKSRVLKNRGLESIGLDPDELKRLSKLLLELAIGKPSIDFASLTDPDKLYFKLYTVESLKTTLQQNAELFAGDENRQKRILVEAWAKIQRIKQLIRLEEAGQKEEERRKKDAERKKKRKEKEKAKLEEKERKQQELEQLKEQQEQLITGLVDECVQELNLLENKFDIHLVRHFYRKREVLEQFLNYAIGETKEAIFNQKETRSREIIENRGQYYDPRDDLSEKIWKTLAARFPVETRAIRRHDVDEISWTEIAKELDNIPRTTLTDKITRNRGEIARIMGELYEQLRAEELQSEFPRDRVILGGGNSSDPDILVKLENDILIYSLKCFLITKNVGKRQIKILEECNPEIQAVKEAGKDSFILDILNMVNGRQFTVSIDVSRLTDTSQVLVPHDKNRGLEVIY
ncbi:MAG: hypothetical protein ACFFD4_02545 [Candidatus Odinarchaeota archaeon]